MSATEPHIEAALDEQRQRLDDSTRRGLRVALWLVFAAGLAQALSTWWGAGSQPMATWRLVLLSAIGVGMSGVALLAQHSLRRQGVAVAAALFSWAALAVLLVLPWITGDGLSDPSLPALGVVVVCMGLLVSPKAAWQALWLGVAGLLLVTLAQALGWIEGPSDLRRAPLPVVALGHLLPLLLSGCLVVHYGRLFWSATRSLDEARGLLGRAQQEQQASAARLDAAERRQHELLDASLTAILIYDSQDGSLLYANPQALGRYGVSTLAELDPAWLAPGDGYGPEEAQALIQRTRDKGPQEQWWCSRRRDGGLLWWDIKTQRLQLDGRDAVVVFGHDISDQVAARSALAHAREELEQQVRSRTRELQQQQQRLQAVLDALPATLAVRDAGGRHQLVNRQFELATGWRREQALGQHSRLWLGAELGAQQDRRDAELLAGGGMQQFEQAMLHPKEGPRTLLVSGVPLPDGETGAQVLSLGVDITALKRQQEQLMQARDEALRQAQAKHELLARMSHELRTPLNAVLGLAQMALMAPPDGQAEPTQTRQAFERIHTAGQHLLGVVNEVLDLAKLEADKFSPALEPLDPAELARDALALVEPRAREKQLPLRLQLDPPLPTAARLDRQRVRQVLVNLLGNAIKFTSQGEVCLQLHTEGQTLVFTVHDTGPGIAATERERVFQDFEQAEGAVAEPGTGLGLAISRRLARARGGDIRLHSQPGLGSQFSLHLPWRPSAPVAHKPAAAPVLPPPEGGRFGRTALQGLRVLIVDDVAINREILGEMLQQLGAQFEQVGGGAEALAWVAQHGVARIDLVLMDIQMPGMDGYEATRRLHQVHPQLPVLALTANALPEQRAQSAAAGMRGHITKPVELAELVSTLREQAQALGLWLGAEVEPPGSPAAPLPPVVTPPPTRPSPPPLGADLPLDWDHEAALARCAGKLELLCRLLGGFVSQYRQEGLPSETTAQLAWVHRLKGTAANLGLMGLSRLAVACEAELRSEPAAAQRALQRLQAALDLQLTQLQAWLELQG